MFIDYNYYSTNKFLVIATWNSFLFPRMLNYLLFILWTVVGGNPARVIKKRVIVD